MDRFSQRNNAGVFNVGFTETLTCLSPDLKSIETKAMEASHHGR